jgi:hypothetical protein
MGFIVSQREEIMKIILTILLKSFYFKKLLFYFDLFLRQLFSGVSLKFPSTGLKILKKLKKGVNIISCFGCFIERKYQLPYNAFEKFQSIFCRMNFMQFKLFKSPNKKSKKIKLLVFLELPSV